MKRLLGLFWLQRKRKIPYFTTILSEIERRETKKEEDILSRKLLSIMYVEKIEYLRVTK
jgi:hypothetical protein